MSGKTIRLRASCNACNESKVRCSQDKPTCARCERNGFECIYGLSRRTHKDAPRISMTPSQRPSRSSSNSNSDTRSDIQRHGSWSTKTAGDIVAKRRAMSGNRSAGTHDAALLDDYMSSAELHFMISSQEQNDIITTTSQAPAASVHPEQLADLNSLIDPLITSATGFLRPSAQYANSWVMDSLFGGNNTKNTDVTMFEAPQIMPTNSNTEKSSPSGGECNCYEGITEILVSIICGDEDHRQLSLDAQLARLKRCMVACESSMGCTHSREAAEPVHVMTIATLIGYVIDEFEMLARENSQRTTLAGEITVFGYTERESNDSSCSDEFTSAKSVVTAAGTSLRSLLEPRLSWGVLELEDDDELDLRRRLYLLSFRKVKKLLRQLTLCLRDLHDTRTGPYCQSRHMAFSMSCDYTLLCLERKAKVVGGLLSSAPGDEIIDPALT